MGNVLGSHRIRAKSSTDEWWLMVALGPGFLGGFLLRVLLGEPAWIVIGWVLACLAAASAGTTWFWVRHGTAHLSFLAIYLAMAVAAVIIGFAGLR